MIRDSLDSLIWLIWAVSFFLGGVGGWVVLGCGAGGQTAFSTSDHRSLEDGAARIAEVERCVGLHAIVPIHVAFDETIECPVSKRRCCLASFGIRQCPNGVPGLCGAAGRFNAEMMLILLPDECDLAFEHEYIHALLYQYGDRHWRQHPVPPFEVCE